MLQLGDEITVWSTEVINRHFDKMIYLLLISHSSFHTEPFLFISQRGTEIAQPEVELPMLVPEIEHKESHCPD